MTPLQESRVDNLVHVLLISLTLSSPEELWDMAEKVPLQESRMDS